MQEIYINMFSNILYWSMHIKICLFTCLLLQFFSYFHSKKMRIMKRYFFIIDKLIINNIERIAVALIKLHV